MIINRYFSEVTYEQAKQLINHDIEVFCILDDDTEASAETLKRIEWHNGNGGKFGVELEPAELMKPLKEIKLQDYYDLCEHGARTLFDIELYRLIDGNKDDVESYFIFDYAEDRFFTIDVKTCYELVTLFFVVENHEYVIECLDYITR